MASTTLTSWALLLWNTLEQRGLDPRIPFAKAGADLTKLADSQARYNATIMPKLWKAAVEQSGDLELGIAVGKNWSPTTFHALGFAWLASNTLLEAFQRLVRYAHIANNSVLVTFEPVGAQYRFTLDTSDKDLYIDPAGNDAGMAAIIQMCRLLVGKNFSPLSMELMRPYRALGGMEVFAGVNPKYGMQENVIMIDAATVERKLATGNSSLVQASEQVAREYLLWLERADITSTVKAKVVELLPSGNISQKLIAEKVHMNVRTLQRRLKEDNLTFKSLVNIARQEIVSDYICNSQMSLTEVSFLLGFADQANFTRAYKRWFGISPSAARKALHLEHQAPFMN